MHKVIVFTRTINAPSVLEREHRREILDARTKGERRHIQEISLPHHAGKHPHRIRQQHFPPTTPPPALETCADGDDAARAILE